MKISHIHYFIDGYNLLFRLDHSSEDFTKSRTKLIENLNSQVELLRLNVTVIFDAHSRIDEESKTRYKHLNLIFTAQNETADDFILRTLDSSSEIIKVVSSDKRLTRQAKERGAQVETVEEFLAFTKKSLQKKIKPKKITSTPKQVQELPVKTSKTPIRVNYESDFEYYLRVFEERVRKGGG